MYFIWFQKHLTYPNKNGEEAIWREDDLLVPKVGPGVQLQQAGARHLARLGAHSHHIVSPEWSNMWCLIFLFGRGVLLEGLIKFLSKCRVLVFFIFINTMIYFEASSLFILEEATPSKRG